MTLNASGSDLVISGGGVEYIVGPVLERSHGAFSCYCILVTASFKYFPSETTCHMEHVEL